MKVIDAKKLIISTLIFLFSSFETPMLADTVPSAPPIEQTQIVFMKDSHYSVQMAYPGVGLFESLQDLVFVASMPLLLIGPYVDGKDGYIMSAATQDTHLEKTLVPVVKYPELFPTFYHAKGCDGVLIGVPHPADTSTHLNKICTLIAFYTAFMGCKPARVHTRPLADAFATFLQCIAASLAQKELVLHTAQDYSLKPLQELFATYAGKTIKDVVC